MLFYCPSTKGFYSLEIHGSNIPEQSVKISEEEYKELIAGQSTGKSIIHNEFGHPVLADPPALTQDAILVSLTQSVQLYLDNMARKRRYDGIHSLCSYATSTDPKFAAEGQAGVVWRDGVWSMCYSIMADVQAGRRTIPTEEELLAELPTFTWPDEANL